MRARRVAGWSNVALASAVVMALTACGGGESEGSNETRSESVAATPSLAPSKTPQAEVSSPSEEREEEGEQAAQPPKVTEVEVTDTAQGDRVTFTFNAAAPEYLDSYEKELNGPEGRPIEIEGDKFLRVAFIAVDPESHFSPPSPNERVPEVRHLMNFEGEMSVGIGIVAPDGAADPAYDITTKGTQVFIDIKE